jgi:hypothetical protein
LPSCTVPVVCSTLLFGQIKSTAPLVPAEVTARKGAVLALACVANWNMWSNPAANQPAEETARSISGVSSKPLRLQTKPLGPDDRQYCSEMKIPAGQQQKSNHLARNRLAFRSQPSTTARTGSRRGALLGQTPPGHFAWVELRWCGGRRRTNLMRVPWPVQNPRRLLPALGP